MNKPNNQNNYVGRVSDSVTRQEADSVVSSEMSGYAALTRPTRLYLPNKELLRQKLAEWGENIEDERDE